MSTNKISYAAALGGNNNHNNNNSAPSTNNNTTNGNKSALPSYNQAVAGTASTTTTTTTAVATAASTNTSSSSSQKKQTPQEDFLSRFIYTKEPHNPGRDDQHIKVLEPDVSKAVTVPFASLLPSNNRNNQANNQGSNNTNNNNSNNRRQHANDDDADGEDTSFPVNARLRAILQQYGFAIVTDVYTPAQCKELEQLWAQDLLSCVVPPANEQQKKAQDSSVALNHIKSNPVYHWPMDKLPVGTKFASDLGLPHGRLAWEVRTNLNVRKVFGSIFGDLSLCTGVDNVFFDNRLNGEDHEDQRTTALWPHADVNSHIPGGDHEIYQGVLYVFEANADTSATVVWPGSHLAEYQNLMKAQDWSKRGHFCPLQKARLPEFVKNARRVPVPSGAMLLWASATIHQGYPGGVRLAVPVSMESKALRPQSAFSAKLALCRSGLPSSHWATLAKQHSLAKTNQPTLEYPGDNSFRVEARAHLHMFKNGDPKNAIKPEIMEKILANIKLKQKQQTKKTSFWLMIFFFRTSQPRTT